MIKLTLSIIITIFIYTTTANAQDLNSTISDGITRLANQHQDIADQRNIEEMNSILIELIKTDANNIKLIDTLAKQAKENKDHNAITLALLKQVKDNHDKKIKKLEARIAELEKIVKNQLNK